MAQSMGDDLLFMNLERAWLAYGTAAGRGNPPQVKKTRLKQLEVDFAGKNQISEDHTPSWFISPASGMDQGGIGVEDGKPGSIELDDAVDQIIRILIHAAQRNLLPGVAGSPL
jgi:hypothetical protein